MYELSVLDSPSGVQSTVRRHRQESGHAGEPEGHLPCFIHYDGGSSSAGPVECDYESTPVNRASQALEALKNVECRFAEKLMPAARQQW